MTLDLTEQVVEISVRVSPPKKNVSFHGQQLWNGKQSKPTPRVFIEDNAICNQSWLNHIGRDESKQRP